MARDDNAKLVAGDQLIVLPTTARPSDQRRESSPGETLLAKRDEPIKSCRNDALQRHPFVPDRQVGDEAFEPLIDFALVHASSMASTTGQPMKRIEAI